MLKQVIGKTMKEISVEDLNNLRHDFTHVVVDLGTGDGKFAYNYAKNNPDAFVIGVDAAVGPLQDLSHKASRKPAKGGLDNVVFIWAAAEQLPHELTGIAHEVYVNFPWGSLLSGVAKAEPEVMEHLVRICSDSAEVHVFLSYDTKFEPETMEGLELPELSLEYLNKTLADKYLQFGLGIVEAKTLDASEKEALTSSWPKKILSKRDREVYYIKCAKVKYED